MKRREFVKGSALAAASGVVLPLVSRVGRTQPLSPMTMYEKIWSNHVVAHLGGSTDLLHVDRHFVHDLHAGAFRRMADKGHTVRCPELTFSIADHSVSTQPGRTLGSTQISRRLAGGLIASSEDYNIRSFGIDDSEQGIVHMVAPEYGMALPGMVIVCGDSHTCTQGALGAMAWGIGSTEVENVLITQSIIQKRSGTFRLNIEGVLDPWVSAKDVILYAIGCFGADAGNGLAVEFAGSSVRQMSMEERLTLCNLSVEMGARVGMVAPDDTTYEYLYGKRHAPEGEQWDFALQHWRTLVSDEYARFDREETIYASDIEPQITWGTSPEHVIGVSGRVPDPASSNDIIGYRAAQAYTRVSPGQSMATADIDRVFIGSCANSRLEDLRIAADVVRGRSVADRVEAWIVPGSKHVKRSAEAEGLDAIFLAAGFQWREPGCSMCLAVNGETVEPGHRCVSTSNRNFVGRQGRDSITHLASPAMAAAAAIAGRMVDVRALMAGESV